MNTMQKVYLDAQAACRLQVGDYVKVLRKAADREGGWDSFWNDDMDKTVGCVGVICAISPNNIKVYFPGIDDWWCYPYFVLEKTEKPADEFKPFEKVLGRNDDQMIWRCDLFSHKFDGFYRCAGNTWRYCIPYEGNEHLVGTTDAPEGTS